MPSLRYSVLVTKGRLQALLLLLVSNVVPLLFRTDTPAAAAAADEDDDVPSSDTFTFAAVVVKRISACLAPASLEFCSNSRYTAFDVA